MAPSPRFFLQCFETFSSKAASPKGNPTTPVSCADSCAGKRNSSCMRGCKVRNTASKRQGFRATPAPNTHCESRSSSGWQRRLNANHGHAVYATDGDPWLKERFLEGSSGDDVVSVIFQQHLLSPLPINRSVDVGVCASRSHCEDSMRFAGVFETGHRRSCAGQSKHPQSKSATCWCQSLFNACAPDSPDRENASWTIPSVDVSNPLNLWPVQTT
jgi:hypothetical protein